MPDAVGSMIDCVKVISALALNASPTTRIRTCRSTSAVRRQRAFRNTVPLLRSGACMLTSAPFALRMPVEFVVGWRDSGATPLEWQRRGRWRRVRVLVRRLHGRQRSAERGGSRSQGRGKAPPPVIYRAGGWKSPPARSLGAASYSAVRDSHAMSRPLGGRRAPVGAALHGTCAAPSLRLGVLR